MESALRPPLPTATPALAEIQIQARLTNSSGQNIIAWIRGSRRLVADIKSECLRVQIGPAAQRLPRGMRRDLFEAGLNEAAGSLAASYGRWSFARSVERIRYSWRGGRGRQRRKGSKRDSREAWTIFAGFHGPTWSLSICKAQVCRRAALDRAHVNIGWARRHGWRAWRHELSHRGAERGGEGCCHESASTMRPPQQGQMSRRRPVSSA